MSNALQALDNVTRTLASITKVEAAKGLRDEAEAFRHYAKIAGKGLKAQNQAAYVKFLCERRGGELLLQLERTKAGPGRGKKHSQPVNAFTKAVKAAGMNTTTAYRWQLLAQYPLKKLREYLHDVDAEGEELLSLAVYTQAQGYVDAQKPGKEEPASKKATRAARPKKKAKSTKNQMPDKPPVAALVQQLVNVTDELVIVLEDLEKARLSPTQKVRVQKAKNMLVSALRVVLF